MALQTEDARYLKRKIKAGNLDVHPTEKALVVNYELEATILGELGDPMLGEKKECQKIIRLKSLNAETDIGALAKEVIQKCSLIHPSKLQEVEQLIYYLQKRKDVALGPADNKEQQQKERGGSGGLKERRPGSGDSEGKIAGVGLKNGDVATINNLDDYVELLYEDIPERIRGSALLLQLFRNPDNLENLTRNETLLGALARVLREDWKRSIEISTNIVYTFFCCSTFLDFHHVITVYKVGSLCMEIVDYELRRYDQWKDDLEKRRRTAECSLTSEPIPEASVEGSPSSSSSSGKKGRNDFEKALRKFQNLVSKQDRLLRVSFYLLLNISEDRHVEDKMRKKNIVGMLIKALERESADLLVLVVTFLKKLAIYVENKDDMADMNIIERISPQLQSDNTTLVDSCVRLLFNLSFDSELRNKMVRGGMLPKLVNFLQEEKLRFSSIGILYHLSMDDKVKSMFTYTECIPILMKIVLESAERRVELEVMALCINLAANKRNAQLICEGGGLRLLMRRGFHFQDPLIMKMIRNIAQHDGPTKMQFVEFVGDLAGVLQKAECEEFVLECVGVLGNLTLPELDFERLLKEYNLVSWLRNNLVPGSCEDDLTLEVVVFLGTTAVDENCAMLLCREDILHALIELLKAKQADDEVVLQIVYVFYQLCRHQETRDFLIQKTDAPAYLLDLMNDRNTEIQRVCGTTLDIIADSNETWAKRIQVEKFRFHNSQWLEMVESRTSAPGLDDEEGSVYSDSDLLNQAVLYQSGTYDGIGDCADLVNANNSDSGNTVKISNRPRSRYSQDLEEYADVLSRANSIHGSGLSYEEFLASAHGDSGMHNMVDRVH